MLNLLLLPTVLGFLNRVRGGLFGDKIRESIPFYGTTLGRLVFALGYGVAVYVLSGLLTLAAITVGTVFLGHAIAPFAPFQFMERSNDILIASLRGAILMGATGVAVATLASPIAGILLAASGLLMGPVYKLATMLPIIPLLNDVPATRSTNDTAEILFGIAQGLALVILL